MGRSGRRELKFLRIRLGHVIRDIRHQIAGNEPLEERFADLLALAVRVRLQDHRQRGRKIYALHAREVECLGKGKARAPYEFGCKVSVATPATKPKGGQFVLRGKALHGNPFDGHTLGPVVAELEALTGIETRRVHVDKSLPRRRCSVPEEWRDGARLWQAVCWLRERLMSADGEKRWGQQC